METLIGLIKQIQQFFKIYELKFKEYVEKLNNYEGNQNFIDNEIYGNKYKSELRKNEQKIQKDFNNWMIQKNEFQPMLNEQIF